MSGRLLHFFLDLGTIASELTAHAFVIEFIQPRLPVKVMAKWVPGSEPARLVR